MANDLIVRILGDTKGLERSFATANRATAQFGANVDTTAKKADRAARSFRGLATGAAAGFGGAIVFNEVYQQLNAAITVASNLQEQIARTNVVFEQSADEIVAWSRTTAKSMGIAQDEALAAAGTFGAMFDQAGKSAADAAGLSRAVVQLASDLASFNNAGVEDTLTALRSGLSGEIEPLRRFQVFLTEAAVSARAMADSNKTAVDQLTQGEKIMARWNLIVEQTTKQQGDFARTSDGLANSQRILAAQTRDLQGQIGSALLPTMESLTGVLVDATDVALQLADALRVLASIRIPTIEIPFTTKEVGGGTFGGAAGQVAGFAALGAISPAALATVGIKRAIDRIRGEAAPAAEVAKLAKAFDDQFATFTDMTVGAVNKSVEKANKRIASFGQKGFKAIETNVLGDKLRDQFEATIDALDLRFDRAQLSGNEQQSLEILNQTEKAIRARIATQGRTTDLLRQLFEVEQQRVGIIRDSREAAKAAADEARELARDQAKAALEMQKTLKQRREFRAIGLSPEGGDITPTIDNLRKQFDQLSKNVVGEDVSNKLLGRLKAVGKVLASGVKDLEEPTRAAIRDLFQTIRSEFDKGAKETGPKTQTQSLNAAKVLEGLGLGRDMEKELRARLSSFNTAGVALAGATRPTGGFGSGPISTRPIVVESHTTVQLDNDVVGRNVTRTQQKARRRNPTQKRGPNSGV